MIRPVARDVLLQQLADWLAGGVGPIRVALDGPPSADPDRLAAELTDPLQARGRRLAHVSARMFWRDASLRLEYGHEDADSYRDWLDVGSLRREVLDAADSYLPSLRDPSTNRSTRAPREPLTAAHVLVVSGTFLLGSGLPFDTAVHLAMSPAARARRTPLDEAWTLPAFDRYDRDVNPAAVADVVVRCDDPAHLAVIGLDDPAAVRRRNLGALRSMQ